jgi:predicted CoA-substrate-specific enzyme activase
MTNLSGKSPASREVDGPILGLDVGTECVKGVMLDTDASIIARASVPTQGYFESCIEQVTKAVLEEAKVERADLAEVVATGFGARCVSGATRTTSDTLAHAVGAHYHNPNEMTVLDIGGREIRAISVGAEGTRTGSREGRKCVSGIGSFLMFAARHLDVHPTRMQELAAEAQSPATISSFCSVFSSNELLERLRDGSSREDVALGCMRAVSERILELGISDSSNVVTGGVPGYFPGVLTQLEQLCSIELTVSPDPIYTGAHGAALVAFRTSGKGVQ